MPAVEVALFIKGHPPVPLVLAAMEAEVQEASFLLQPEVLEMLILVGAEVVATMVLVMLEVLAVPV
jgi:hypothetical protein